MLQQPGSRCGQTARRAYADNEFPQRPQLGKADDRNLHRAAASPGGGLRHNGDANPRLDHATDLVKTTDADAEAQ